MELLTDCVLLVLEAVVVPGTVAVVVPATVAVVVPGTVAVVVPGTLAGTDAEAPAGNVPVTLAVVVPFVPLSAQGSCNWEYYLYSKFQLVFFCDALTIITHKVFNTFNGSSIHLP